MMTLKNAGNIKNKFLISEHLKNNSALFISLFILSIIIISLYSICIKASNGNFIYTLDDAFIHMAYAKNIVLNNVWGITQYEYTSSISSPLWTLILCLSYFLFGVSDYIPFILNIIFSFTLISVLYWFLRAFNCSNFYTGIILIFTIIVLPVSFYIFSGMEHLLHTILSLLFIYFAALVLSLPDSNVHRHAYSIYLLLLSLLLPSIRYEGIYLVLIVSVLFLIRKKFLLTLFLLLMCMAFPVLVGVISLLNDNYFLPNSILVNVNVLPLLSNNLEFGTNLHIKLMMNKRLIILLIVSVLFFTLQLMHKKDFWSIIPLMLFLTIVLTLIQNTTTVFRYNAYIIVIGMAINAVALSNYMYTKYNLRVNLDFFRKNKYAQIGLLLLFMLLFWKEFYFDQTIRATKNIYEQQYQMAIFLNKFYSGQSIAANDIGAINYYSDIKCMDLVGIGTKEIMKEKINNTLSTENISEISRVKNVQIAILYDDWFSKIGLPPEWSKVGEWKIEDNFICGSDRISFYAVDKSEKLNLMKNLANFSDALPPGVVEFGEYTLNLTPR